ncbi:ABC transporter ATP-binding protein [Coraliomargarita sinensis]|uniref:ABC transporter ATP-binding protein n=1 Tax=Coraliomargarita sinensis TaxID=2174842 RepID=A0A317ZLE7_9BACT|nr:ABC transporter ATP-binding protein [Coraliomargarita sinensis]PXA04768.1 ABC transporter ATP-binding protein [Coraliomargarita sinensis]
MTSTAQNPALTAGALSIGYEQGADKRCLAEDLSVSLMPGEFVCLLGPNGVGKSTLIRTLAGMQSPLAGQIQIAGKNFGSIPPRERARLVSVVLTEAAPIGLMDAYAMVSLGRHPYSGWFGSLDAHDRGRIEWAFEAVGAKHLAQRQVAELSDGERQKITIARALAQETQVMLLDEPTAFLDLPRRVELMRILRNLAHREKLALLLSTHDLDLALRFADRLWVLSGEGELIQGYPEAIAMSGDFARVFESNNLDWDPQTGSFRTHPTPCLHAKIEGEGVAALWTRRALERLGFGICEDASDAAFSIHIKGSAWQVTRGDQQAEFDSIDAVIDWVLNQKWA